MRLFAYIIPIMDLLRDCKEVIDWKPEDFLVYVIVENVRNNIDVGDYFVPSPKQLTDKFNLNPVFQKILDDPIKDC